MLINDLIKSMVLIIVTFLIKLSALYLIIINVKLCLASGSSLTGINRAILNALLLLFSVN